MFFGLSLGRILVVALFAIAGEIALQAVVKRFRL